MLERQFADFVFAQLDAKVPALRNEENGQQVKEVQTLIAQLKIIVDASTSERNPSTTRRGKRTSEATTE